MTDLIGNNATFQVDFKAPRRATEKINSWVADQTSNNVKEMFRHGVISRSTAIAITNAIYFKVRILPISTGFTYIMTTFQSYLIADEKVLYNRIV